MNNYKQVYFRIDAPSYYKSKYGVGFENQEDKKLFFKTITEIFLNDGWEIKKEKYNSGCPTVTKEKQELYLHPQELSGVVKEENIFYIEKLISNSDLFKFEKTDIYEDVFDLTDDEYIKILESKRSEIEKDLLEIYKTKRSNLYITNTVPLSRVLDKYRIKRLSQYIGVYSNNNIDWQYIEGMLKDLVNQKKIVTADTKHGMGYRTAKGKELKGLTVTA